jgi:integrase
MLSDSKVRNLKPADKRKTYADAEGLYVDVLPTGKKSWLFRYTKDGKRHWLTLGEYPIVGLQEARELRNKAKRKLYEGLSPKEEEKPVIRAFESVAREWYEKNIQRWNSEKTRVVILRRLVSHVFAHIGNADISAVTSKDVLSLIRQIEERGTIETARRVIQLCSQIFQYAVACEYREYDPTQSIHKALAASMVKHLASLTKPSDVAHLLRSINAYPHPIVRYAMQFSALVFLRPGEVRHTEWSEIAGNELRIPEQKMKMKRPHIVPLATQTLEVLDKLRPLTGHGKYVFPSNRAPRGNRPMSENTVLVALRAMGYTKDQMTPHGFRSMASTLLNENGFNRDWIERQLAHVEGNNVRAAYNYAEYLPERRRKMQGWADDLDELRKGRPAGFTN